MTDPVDQSEQIRLDDLEAFIRDTLYSHELDGSGIVMIARHQVSTIAASIARRAIVGR